MTELTVTVNHRTTRLSIALDTLIELSRAETARWWGLRSAVAESLERVTNQLISARYSMNNNIISQEVAYAYAVAADKFIFQIVLRRQLIEHIAPDRKARS